MKKARPAYRFNLVLIALISLPMLSGITLYRHLDFSQVESSVPLEVSIDFTSVPQDFIATDSPKTVAIEPLAKQSPYSFWLRWTAQNADIALAIWLIGALLFTIRMLGGFIFLNRLKTKAKLIEDSALLINLDQFCKQLKIKGKVLLKQSEAISSPLVMGVLKPVIIFPLGLIQALPTEEIEAILLHELAHIKRNDFLINIVINVLQVVYFYHPAFWWLNAQLDDEREYDCDESTVLLTSNPLVLAKALTRISEFNLQPSTPALAFAGRRNQMLKRIKRIVQRQPQTNWLSGLLSFSLLLLSFFLMSYSSFENETSLEDKKTNTLDMEQTPYFEPETLSLLDKWINEELTQDTSKVAAAILEILAPNSPIQVEANGNNSFQILTIKRGDKLLEGEEFDIYAQAYERIQEFAKQQIVENIRSNSDSQKEDLEMLRRELAELQETYVIAQSMLQEKSKIDSTRNKYQRVELQEILEFVKEQNKEASEKKSAQEVRTSKVTGLKIKTVRSENLDSAEAVRIVGSIEQNARVVYEINGEILESGLALDVLDPNLIQNISVIKNKSELARLSLDTTLVEGIIRIVTKPNVDWKAATNSSSPRVRLRGITVITVKDEKSDQERIRDREPIKVPVEVDGVRGASLKAINPADIKSLSVIKNDAELHERNYDTTQVEGIIIIETNKGIKKKKERSEKSIYLKNVDSTTAKANSTKASLEFALADKTDAELIYALDGKIVSEKQFKMAGDQMKYIDVLSNLAEIRILHPELKGDKIKLVRASTSEEHNMNPDSIFEKKSYQVTSFSSEYEEISFGNVISQAEQKEITFARLKNSNPIIELDGVLRPDLSIQQLDYLLIKKVIIIQGDRIYDYHKKREVKGKDTLVKVFTK
ncbi:MAG: beta-lactamase regulating signal transducer with metallopeptidase domain [Roseivirga sp.]|jgi:beta-lactamase regulating signal transducer with metallopeptidase domain